MSRHSHFRQIDEKDSGSLLQAFQEKSLKWLIVVNYVWKDIGHESFHRGFYIFIFQQTSVGRSGRKKHSQTWRATIPLPWTLFDGTKGMVVSRGVLASTVSVSATRFPGMEPQWGRSERPRWKWSRRREFAAVGFVLDSTTTHRHEIRLHASHLVRKSIGEPSMGRIMYFRRHQSIQQVSKDYGCPFCNKTPWNHAVLTNRLAPLSKNQGRTSKFRCSCG